MAKPNSPDPGDRLRDSDAAEGDPSTVGENVTLISTEDVPPQPAADGEAAAAAVGAIGLDDNYSVKNLLERLKQFLLDEDLERKIDEERRSLHRSIDSNKEQIQEKKEIHRHMLNDIHEAYKREIQKENERFVSALEVIENEISDLTLQLDYLEKVNRTFFNGMSTGPRTNSALEIGGMRELLECPVCYNEMKAPKKIFQCSNGHLICEMCKNHPEVRSCPTCRVMFRGGTVVRNILAEKFARSAFDYESGDERALSSCPLPTMETRPIDIVPPRDSSAEPPAVRALFRTTAGDDDLPSVFSNRHTGEEDWPHLDLTLTPREESSWWRDGMNLPSQEDLDLTNFDSYLSHTAMSRPSRGRFFRPLSSVELDLSSPQPIFLERSGITSSSNNNNNNNTSSLSSHRRHNYISSESPVSSSRRQRGSQAMAAVDGPQEDEPSHEPVRIPNAVGGEGQERLIRRQNVYRSRPL